MNLRAEHPDLACGHFVAGQGARLVGADHGGTTERLDSREVSHDSASLRHPLDAGARTRARVPFRAGDGRLFPVLASRRACSSVERLPTGSTPSAAARPSGGIACGASASRPPTSGVSNAFIASEAPLHDAKSRVRWPRRLRGWRLRSRPRSLSRCHERLSGRGGSTAFRGRHARAPRSGRGGSPRPAAATARSSQARRGRRRSLPRSIAFRLSLGAASSGDRHSRYRRGDRTGSRHAAARRSRDTRGFRHRAKLATRRDGRPRHGDAARRARDARSWGSSPTSAGVEVDTRTPSTATFHCTDAASGSKRAACSPAALSACAADVSWEATLMSWGCAPGVREAQAATRSEVEKSAGRRCITPGLASLRPPRALPQRTSPPAPLARAPAERGSWRAARPTQSERRPRGKPPPNTMLAASGKTCRSSQKLRFTISSTAVLPAPGPPVRTTRRGT